MERHQRLRFSAPDLLPKTALGALLVAGLVSFAAVMPGAAWATADEEPGLGLAAIAAVSVQEAAPAEATVLNFDTHGSVASSLGLAGEAKPMTVAGEPVRISEATPSPFYAGRSVDAYRQQSSAVANFVARYNRNLAGDEASTIADAIVQFSGRYGVDYRLVASLIAVESSFRHDAISSSGAIGMGQLKPDTARWLGVVDPYDPVDNIAGTTRFLAWLVRKYNGNLEAALSAYYQGPGFVDKNGVAPVCMPYLEKINRTLGALL